MPNNSAQFLVEPRGTMRCKKWNHSFYDSIGMNSFFAIASVALVSCTEPRAAPQTARPALTKTIQILSEPPGARIEVNDDYIGEAPCSAQVRCNSEGRFFETTHIRALPAGNGYTQSK